MKKSIQTILISFLCSLTFLHPLFSKDGTNILKVGFFTDSPFLITEDTNSGIKSGYGYAYLQMISNFTGWEYEYIYGTWGTLWDMVQKGEIDILEDVSYTPERAKNLLFPDKAMGNETYRLYVLNKDSDIRADNLSKSLKNKKIGITANSYQYDLFIDWLKKYRIECSVIPYIDDSERNHHFREGLLDGIVDLEASTESDWEPVIEIGRSDYYMVLSKGNEQHLEELNKALTSLETVIPDYNNTLFYTYYARMIVSSRLSLTEQEWLNNHKTLKIGYRNDHYSTTLSDAGVVKPIINEILRILNIENLDVQYSYFQDGNQMMQALQSGDIDICYPVSTNLYESELSNYSPLADINNQTFSIVCQKNKDFNDITYIGVPDTTGAILHTKIIFPKSTPIIYSSGKKIMDDVAANILDAAILPHDIIEKQIDKKSMYSSLEVTKLTTPYKTGIAVKQGNSSLFMLLRRGISLMNPQFIPGVVSDFSKVQYDYSLQSFITNHFWTSLIIVLVIFALVLYTLLTINRHNILERNLNKEKSLRNELSQALRRTEEHQQKVRELLYLSETDKLTGIANRGVEGKIRQFMEIGTLGMFCLFDVDKFKSINDNYGHLTGDKVLISIAECMKKVFRDTDIILRLGGDEFAAFTIGITSEEIASSIINRLFTEIDNIQIPELEDHKVSISLGAAFVKDEKNCDFEKIYKKADEGCYLSKRHEGNYSTFVKD